MEEKDTICNKDCEIVSITLAKHDEGFVKKCITHNNYLTSAEYKLAKKTDTKLKCEDCGTECLFLDEDEEEYLCEVCIGDSEYPRFCEPCQNEWIARCTP